MTASFSSSGRAPRILLTDAVPVNGGDEALLVGLLHGLRQVWADADFTILSRRASQSRKLLPQLHIESSLGSTWISRWTTPDEGRRNGKPGLPKRLIARLAHAADVARVSRFYRRSDLVVSVPGGFLSDHYDIVTALQGFELAWRLGKPLVLFGQSIGPIAESACREALGKALSGAAMVAVRDEPSRRCLVDCGIEGDRVVSVPDVAFLWRQFSADLYREKTGPPKRAGLCFRRWPYRDREEFRKTVSKARRLVEFLATRGVEQFLFASTCQGVPDYIDDSELSSRIVSGLAPELQRRCEVDRDRHHPRDLIRLLGGCDVFFGMRLHACLLAMLGGTPAMGIAYEPKTPEIFGQLGLKSYQVSFTAYQTRWCACAARLLDDLDDVRRALPERLDRMQEGVQEGLMLLRGFVEQMRSRQSGG